MSPEFLQLTKVQKMKTIEESIKTAFESIIASGKIEEAIELQLSQTITSSVKRHLEGYSDFGKQIDAAVKGAIQVDMSQLGLPGYNDLILKVIRKAVDANMNAVLATQVEEQMAALLQPAPGEITLSKLLEDFIKHIRGDSCHCDGDGEISLHMESSTGLTSGYWNIYFDQRERKDRYSCEFKFGVTDTGKMYSLSVGQMEVGKTMFLGPTYGFERDLIQMYAAGTKLVIDGESADDFEIRYSSED